MFTRQARKNEEVWLMDVLEELQIDDHPFRSREYMFLFQEGAENPSAFARGRLHRTDEDQWGELNAFHVLGDVTREEAYAELTEALVDQLYTEGLAEDDMVYVFSPEPDVFSGTTFETVNELDLPEFVRNRIRAKEEYLEDSTTALGEEVEVAGKIPEDETAPNVGDIDEEKKSQGLDDDDMTYKYST